MKERNYGLDLLRLVLMYLISLLHTLGQGGILAFCDEGSVKYKAFLLIDVITFCAVDGFAILSGYTASEKPRKFEKIVDMWFQAFFYSFVLTLIFIFIGIGDPLGKSEMIDKIFLVTNNEFWYFTAFFLLFFTIPVLNKFIFSIDLSTAKKAFIIIIVLFSVISLFGDPFVSQRGYSALWLIALYCMGALAKKIKLFESRSSLLLFLLFAASVLMTWAIQAFLNIKRFLTYSSPMILLCGVLLVVIFSRFNLKGKIISKLSPLAFGIYLFQVSEVVWNDILQNVFVFIVNEPLAMGILFTLGCALAVFLSGMIVEFIRSKLAKLLKINYLCKKIVQLSDFVMEKMFFLLK